MGSESPNAGSSILHGSQETTVSGGEIHSIGGNQYRSHIAIYMNPGTQLDLGNGSTLTGRQSPFAPSGDSGKGRSASPLHPGTQPHRSFTPEAHASAEGGESPNARYERHLLTKKHGFPLWAPQPHSRLPLSYRRKGVSVGDVGIITREGHFDFLFNICLARGHASNPEFLPINFKQVYLLRTDILELRQHDSGSCLLTSSAEKLRGLTFQCNGPEGSILVMPNGAFHVDLLTLHKFKRTMSQNAENWYKFAIGTCGRDIGNGELRLVTGCDKTNSWGIATYSDFLPGTVTLTSNGVQSPVEYTWEYEGRVEAKAGPKLDESLDAAGNQEYPPHIRNQCTFLRAYTITLADDMWKSMVSTLLRDSPDNYILNSREPLNYFTSFVSRSFLRFGGQGGSVNTRHHNLGSKRPTTHPATVINQMLLSKYPNAKVAISHDSDWCAVIREDEMTMPDASELLNRIQQTFVPHLDDDGAVYLSHERAPEANSQPRSPSPDEFVAIPEYSKRAQEISSNATGNTHGGDGKLSARARGKKSKGSLNTAISEGIVLDDVRGLAVEENAKQFSLESMVTIPPIPAAIGPSLRQARYPTQALIAVIGGTGTGKSTFINSVIGKNVTGSGHGLESQTYEIREYSILMPNGVHVTLVDTPGFSHYDDCGKPDQVILEETAAFLRAKYDGKRRFSGILYLLNICDPIAGSSLKRNVAMFEKLCGPDALKNVVVVTTFWDELESLTQGIETETRLKTKDKFFKGLVDGKSRFARSGKYPQGKSLEGPEFPSPISIVSDLLALSKGKTAEETPAGVGLYKELQELKRQQKRDVIELNQEIAEMKAINVKIPPIPAAVGPSLTRPATSPLPILIAVIGGLGTGKSTFINSIIGKDVAEVGHGLESPTNTIREYSFSMSNGVHVTLVDTPGSNDYTTDNCGKSDLVILSELSTFLEARYDDKRKFSGILYLLNICDSNIGGSLQRNVAMFEKVCGPDPLRKVVVVTTFWDEVDLTQGVEEETGLKSKDKFFKGLVDGNSRFARSGKYPPGKTPKGPEFPPPISIVSDLLALDPVFVEMQKELTEGMAVEETSAGTEFYEELQEFNRVVTKLHQKIAEVKAINSKTPPILAAVGPSLRQATFPMQTLIAVIGRVGTGKSMYINSIIGKGVAEVGHDLYSQTTKIEEYGILMPNGVHVTLVDTPGFNDYATNNGGKSDLVILSELSAFLKEKYDGKYKFSAILYLCNISDPKVGGSLLRNIAMFTKLCGPGPLPKVVVITTFWDEVNLTQGVEKEKELKTKDKFFKGLVDGKSEFARSGKYPSGKTPKGPEFTPPISIISDLLALDPVFVKMQKELAAGLQELKRQHRRDVEDLNRKIAKMKPFDARDREAREELENEKKALTTRFEERKAKQRGLYQEVHSEPVHQFLREKEASTK